METGFQDPIKIQKPQKKRGLWNYEAPLYDERSSCYVSAGTDYGVGHKQPVGHSGNPKRDVIPRTDEVKTQSLYPKNTSKETYVIADRE